MGGGKKPFKGRQATAAVILWATRWYLPFPIPCCDRVKLPARLGQGHPAAMTVEQAGPRFLLQIPDLTAARRLGDAELDLCPWETPGPADLDEMAQLENIHR